MKVFVIAGEPSGDKLGGALMAGLRTEVPDVTFEGIGGPLMQGQGVQSLFAMEELSLMGIAEILPKYRHLKRRIRETAEAVIAAKPDVLITIDSPDFCLRVARLVKAASDIRTVHYVAPTVWAWRAGRAQKMARHIDHVLALFPFEPPYMQAAGMECDFVGHPVAGEPAVTEDEVAALINKYGLAAGADQIVILPGSRRSEIERLGDTFVSAIQAAKIPNKHVILPTLPHLRDRVAEVFAPVLKDGGGVIVDGTGLSPEGAARERLVAMAAGDVALAASGTVSLELAAARTPMVIAYDMNWISRVIISRMLLTDTVTLVNLVSETRVVPEFIGKECQPGPIANALEGVFADPAAQYTALEATMQRLGRGGDAPGLRAARAVLARL
ncbi:lipid-A-disaccharide synthase [Octadecabacter sp. G9-8]|uniref:Lipid-A-disaccharide synthase n=1 Tax=Octadecabacter dasysiphoniae TaxID=2909341 RepID=A0ABS9CW21_9RHOB|nr:lipid-A-disaccharide synthase [Octadecabacter dasysiphoniae]MCF2870585.1 lipid-A-disaccharide synthase [Octadecabacter dasysiphoniae]